ncbi:MAG: hypothetical protein LBR06_10750 [Bacteroidales bacterium]|jgi:hypothetical protein|nr:hypothetical protein [Bacteroidales bacterium]
MKKLFILLWLLSTAILGNGNATPVQKADTPLHHLGNTRITYHYADTTAVVEQDVAYYPFGTMHPSPTQNLSANRRLFGGKEPATEMHRSFRNTRKSPFFQKNNPIILSCF